MFEGKLHKGETVYYEVVGFTDDGTPIMASCDNKKVGDKDFVKQYGKQTVFSYGCSPDGVDAPKSALYVYRMTITNEDGDVVEYPPFYMRYRCEQMGVNCVPLLWSGFVPENDNPVCRIVNRPKFTAYKHKNFAFKVLEGIVKEVASAPDMEEAQEVTEAA